MRETRNKSTIRHREENVEVHLELLENWGGEEGHRVKMSVYYYGSENPKFISVLPMEEAVFLVKDFDTRDEAEEWFIDAVYAWEI